jgi:hypothetical protein
MPDASPTRILIFGNCNGIFIAPFCEGLKKRGRFEFSVFEFYNPGGETRGVDPAIFANVLTKPEITAHPGAVREMIGLVGSMSPEERGPFLRKAAGRLFDRRSSASVGTRLQAEMTRFKYHKALRPKLAGYDIYNLHYFDPSMRDVVKLLPESAPLVVSVWGSDLFQMTGLDAFAAQLEICERANLITILSLEMKEMFLAKYGRHLEKKIRLADFGLTRMDTIDRHRSPETREHFLLQHGIDASRRVLCVGQSGAVRNRHFEVLAALKTLPLRHRDQLAIVVPLTYAAKPAYVAKVEQTAAELGLKIYVLKTFMTEDDVARLRVCADIMIQMPSTDACSGAMCETLYAENLVIAGAWLPYGMLRRKGVYYREVESVSEIVDDLAWVLDHYDEEKKKTEGNRGKIRALLDPEKALDAWVSIYSEANLCKRPAMEVPCSK